MILSCLMKKTNDKKQGTLKNGSSPATTVKSLPKDLLVEVVARVASHSFTDLQSVKMCCKDFLNASEDNHVLQQVSLDKFPLIQNFLNDEALSFLKRCRESGNLESLFREGTLQFFKYPNEKVGGLEMLKVAAEKGHKGAKYMYGMILLCSKDDGLRKLGLEHMRFLRTSMCIITCRKRVKQFERCMWRYDRVLEPNHSPLCSCKSTCKGWRIKNGGWLLLDDEDDDLDSCEYCRWDHELQFFYELFDVR
ncbi:putative F-box protein At1g67623 [Abrus precatorius]|uniref:F-box protein At1g67623 n=1 Tax=Abrus precatorius TaxID=3816 RepID=A0A8B8KWW3_ABRPR|nr:putative F-box protein At1g67623 [Abrus precatorius]